MQVGHIISLMRSGIDVAIVTAAGYPGQPDKFEERVAGLLAAFRKLRLPDEITDRYCSLKPLLTFHGIQSSHVASASSTSGHQAHALAEGVHACRDVPQKSAGKFCVHSSVILLDAGIFHIEAVPPP